MYGKEELRPRRKMERLSVVGETEIDPRGKTLNDQLFLHQLIERTVHARGMTQMVPVNGNA